MNRKTSFFAFFLLLLFISTELVSQQQLPKEKKLDSLKRTIPSLPDSLKYEALIEVGYDYLDIDIDSAKKYMNQLLELIPVTNKPEIEARTYLIMGYILSTTEERIDSAFYWFYRCYHLADSIGHTFYTTQSLIFISDVFNNLVDYDKSLEYAKMAADVSMQNGDTAAYIYSLSSLAQIYSSLEDYPSASVSINKGLQLVNNIRSEHGPYLKRDLMLKKSDVYLNQNKTDSAIIYYRKSIHYPKENEFEDKHRNAFIYLSLGRAFITLNEYDSARMYLNKALNIYSETHTEIFINDVNLYLGELALKEKQYLLAINLIEGSLLYFKKSNMTLELLNSLQLLNEAYSALGQVEKAYSYLNEYNHLEDSIAIVDQKIEYTNKQFLEKIKHIEQQKSSLSDNLEDSKQKLQIYFIIILIIIGVVVFISYRYLYYKKLNQQNFLKIQELTEQALKTNTDVKLKETVSPKPVHTIKEEVKVKISGAFKNWIQKEQYLNPITIEEISKKLNTNQKYLSAVINEEYGQNFTDLINELRISYLLKKLQTDKSLRLYSVVSLSQHLGFKSKSTFYKIFKEHTGMTPSVYIHKIATQKN